MINYILAMLCIYLNVRKALIIGFFFYTTYSFADVIVGRDSELKTIKQILKKERFITITGMSGIGKTALAREFLEKNGKTYEIMWWFQEEEEFETKLINLGYHLNERLNQVIVNSNYSAEINLEKMKEYLKNTHSKMFFVFDNFFHIDSILAHIPCRNNFTFMVTSLNTFNKGYTMVLQKLTRVNSIKLIQSKIKCTNEQADKLARTLKDHPLNLVQATAYIATRPGMDIGQYIEFYQQTLEQLWQKEEGLKQGKIIDKTLYSTLSIVLNRLQKENPQGYKLICYFAVYNKYIPKEALEKIYLDYIGNDKIGFFEALASLKKYSLIEEGQNKNEIIFSCHDSIFKVLRVRLGETYVKKIISNVVKVLKVFFPTFYYMAPMDESVNLFFINNKRLLEYAYFVAREGKKQDIQNVDHILCVLFHYYLFVASRYDMASHFIKNLDEYYRVNSEIENINKAYYHYLKGIYYAWNYTDYEKSNAEYIKAIQIMERLTKSEKYYKMYPLLFMAMNHCYRGDLEKANQLIEEAQKNALGALVRIVERDKPFFFPLAQVNVNTGQYKEALEYIVLTPVMPVVQNKESLKPYHVEWLVMYCRILGHIGKAKEGYIILHKAYEAFEIMIGTKKHDTYMTLCIALAELCKLKKDFMKMKQYLSELKDYLPKVYSKEEINCAEYNRLQGDYFFLKKEYKKALQSYLLSESIYSTIFVKYKHEDVRQLLKQLVKTCIKLERYAQYGHYLNIYRDVFGDQDLKELMSF